MNIWNWKMSAAVGAALWASWALYVNWEAGAASATRSALAQGAVSACSISLLCLLADRTMSAPWPHVLARFVGATLLPWLTLLSLIIAVHFAVDTHDVFHTVLPSSTVGLVYIAIYVFKNMSKFAPDASSPIAGN